MLGIVITTKSHLTWIVLATEDLYFLSRTLLRLSKEREVFKQLILVNWESTLTRPTSSSKIKVIRWSLGHPISLLSSLKWLGARMFPTAYSGEPQIIDKEGKKVSDLFLIIILMVTNTRDLQTNPSKIIETQAATLILILMEVPLVDLLDCQETLLLMNCITLTLLRPALTPCSRTRMVQPKWTPLQ